MWMDMLKKMRALSFRTPAVAAALLAVAMCGSSATAFAEDTTGYEATHKTPEGSWLYTVTIPGYTFLGIETYSAGGGYSEADQLSFNPEAVASAGHGVWKCTGDRSFLLTYLNLTFDSFAAGDPTGTLKVRQNTRMDKSGNYYTGSGDYTYYDVKGRPEPSISGTFTITAKRILPQEPK